MKKIAILAMTGIMMVSAAACGSSGSTSTESNTQAETEEAESSAAESPEDETEAQETTASDATFAEQDKVLLDNDLVKITLTGEVEDTNYVGYSIIIENKSDMNILVDTDNTSVDGFMTYINIKDGSVAAQKKSKTEMAIYTSDGDIKSLDDLKNIEGSFTIYTNTDGSNSYSGNGERYPFQIIGRATNEGSAGENLSDSAYGLGETVAVVSADTVDTALQGSWDINGVGTFTFTNGKVEVETPGSTMYGTYEVSVENSAILGHFEVTDGVVSITMPYIYEDSLRLFNNNNEELTKK